MIAGVTFYLDRDPMPWRPADADGLGLPGGAELATVRVAEALAARGHRVTVHANIGREETHRGVRYLPRAAFDRTTPVHAFLCVNVPEILDDAPPAGTTLLWLHRPDAGSLITPARAHRVDAVLALSSWHETHIRTRHPELASRVVGLSNGVELERFSGPANARRDQRVIATHQPERGLDVLLELWPAVRERVPEAELVYTYAPVYDYIAAANPRVAAHRRRIADLARQPGVRALGVLARDQLAASMAAASVWAHPSWATIDSMPFHEISCIGALEAQAAGLWVVASALGALPETVRVGALVDAAAAPGTEWRAALVDEIARGLTDPALRSRAETEGPAAVAHLGWDRIAARLTEIIEEAPR